MASRRRARRWGWVLASFGACVLSLLTALPASAQNGRPGFDENDQIVLTGGLVIASDGTVDTAAILNGPALIEGTVRESVFVLNGDVEISGTVNEDVVVFNGDVVIRSSAEIGGDLVTQRTPQIEEGATIRGSTSDIATRFDDVDLVGAAGRFAWWLGYSVSVLILGLLLLVFAPTLDEAVRAAARLRLGSSIGWGVALFLLLPIVSVLLLVTVVGLPLGLFVLLGLALIYTLGYTMAPIAVGSLVMKSSPSRFVVFLVGWAILRVLALIPVVGGLLWLVASAWGLGLLAVAIRSGRTAVPMTAPAVPPAPPTPVAGT
jgi:hypothetical protein